MPFLPPNQQRQSTEGKKALKATAVASMKTYTKHFSRLAYFVILITKNNQETVKNFRQINQHLYVWDSIQRCHLHTKKMQQIKNQMSTLCLKTDASHLAKTPRHLVQYLLFVLRYQQAHAQVILYNQLQINTVMYSNVLQTVQQCNHITKVSQITTDE